MIVITVITVTYCCFCRLLVVKGMQPSLQNELNSFNACCMEPSVCARRSVRGSSFATSSAISDLSHSSRYPSPLSLLSPTSDRPKKKNPYGWVPSRGGIECHRTQHNRNPCVGVRFVTFTIPLVTRLFHRRVKLKATLKPLSSVFGHPARHNLSNH